MQSTLFLHSVLLFCLLHISNAATCSPPAGLRSWSSTYSSTVATDIVINTPVLVDSAVIVARGITIAQGGILFFDGSLQSISLTANYILINSGGSLLIGSEACPYTQRVTITLANPQGTNTNAVFGSNFIGVMAGGVLELHGAKGLGRGWTKLAQTAVAGSTSIQVAFGVATWQPGDSIVVSTTDYSPLQSEVVTITSINGNTISFTPSLAYDHFGLITQNVDERAEVGLLTRNILIQGKSNNGGYYGGHLMVARGFSQAHIEGVEFNNMGQDEIGRYPVHFHMCGDAPAGTYVRYNSIHDSNFRCVAIHATNGVLVEGNVAYKNLGHCYFLEDGVEQNNVFRGNLAVLTLPKDFGQKIGSDASNTGLSSFWISNPQNTFEGNVAVGSYTAGFWIITRLGARGISACQPQYQNLPYRFSNLQLTSFKDNTAHSCDFGLGIESTFWDSGDVPAQTCDTPVANWEPHSVDGSMAWTYFDNFTAHHSRQRGVWARMPNIIIDSGRFADNYESLEFATSGDHPPYASQQVVQNSIIVGFSNNKGNQRGTNTQFQAWDAGLRSSIPVFAVGEPVNGIKIYDGPQVIVNSVFTNFPTTLGRPVDSPIGARIADQSQVATTNYLQNVQFIGVDTRYSVIDDTMDGGITGNFRDVDGSVTGFAGATALRDFPYYKTNNCRSSGVYMLACPHKYAQLWVLDMTANGANNDVFITRAHLGTGATPSSNTLQFTGFQSGPLWRYQPIVSVGSSYLLRFQNRVPSSLALQLNNVEQGESVNFAICYPQGTIIQAVQRGYASYTGSPYPTNQPQSLISTLLSVPLLSALIPNTYFYDAVRSILYVKVQQRNARVEYGNFCPPQGCDFAWITAQFPVTGAARDCTQDAQAAGFFVSNSDWLNQQLQPSNPSLQSVLTQLLNNLDFALPSTVPSSAAGSRPTASPTPPPTSPPVTSSPTTSAPTTTPVPTTTPSRAPTSAPTVVPTVPTSAGSCNCSAGQSCCGSACYSPQTYSCFNGNQLCPTGFNSCGGACYSPSAYTCVSGYLQPVS